MLYLLTQHLTPHFSGFNVFSYLTFRAILATISSLAISLLVGPVLGLGIGNFALAPINAPPSDRFCSAQSRGVPLTTSVAGSETT